ncbi:MAG: hypothetical protein KDM64_18425, partial [Verrucomicrobiae bacterium]|nr:hypothetical protein [Verrucomicrobiae bacterium]
MDDTSGDGTYSRNELTLHLDLVGKTGVALSFWAKSFFDEPDGPPSSPFLDGADFDGVAVSDDGETWYEIQPLRSEISSTWTRFQVSLDNAIDAHGLSVANGIQVRFNHFDNYPISSDGFAFDDIVVEELQVGVSVPDMTSATDSGVSDVDNITKFRTPVFQGTTDFPGSVISVYSHQHGLVGTGTATAGGTWTISAATPLGNGTHLVYAQRAGGIPSPAISIIVDSIPPYVPNNLRLEKASDHGVSNEDGKTNDNTPTFAGDADSSSTVELLLDDQVKSSFAGNLGWKNTLSPVPDGEHQVRARAFDTAGNMSKQSSPISFNIDTQAPNRPLNVRLLPESDLGASNSDGLTSDDSPRIGGLTGVPTTIEVF